MNRRGFFATMIAPIVAKFAPKRIPIKDRPSLLCEHPGYSQLQIGTFTPKLGEWYYLVVDMDRNTIEASQ